MLLSFRSLRVATTVLALTSLAACSKKDDATPTPTPATTPTGVSWTVEQDISDASSGAPYKSVAGFASPYGDYDGVAVTNTGKTVAISGQGASFGVGPGNVWVNWQI